MPRTCWWSSYAIYRPPAPSPKASVKLETPAGSGPVVVVCDGEAATATVEIFREGGAALLPLSAEGSCWTLESEGPVRLKLKGVVRQLLVLSDEPGFEGLPPLEGLWMVDLGFCLRGFVVPTEAARLVVPRLRVAREPPGPTEDEQMRVMLEEAPDEAQLWAM